MKKHKEIDIFEKYGRAAYRYDCLARKAASIEGLTEDEQFEYNFLESSIREDLEPNYVDWAWKTFAA